MTIRWGIVAKNPTSGIKILKENSRTRYRTKDETMVLLNGCRSILYSIVLTPVYSGVRLGERLKKKRMDMGLFQKDVARMIGVSTDTITNWEKGRTKPCRNSELKSEQFLAVKT